MNARRVPSCLAMGGAKRFGWGELRSPHPPNCPPPLCHVPTSEIARSVEREAGGKASERPNRRSRRDTGGGDFTQIIPTPPRPARGRDEPARHPPPPPPPSPTPPPPKRGRRRRH